MAIEQLTALNRKAPSISDVATYMAITKSGAQRHMESLHVQGLLTKPYVMGEWALRVEAKKILEGLPKEERTSTHHVRRRKRRGV